MNQNNLPFLMGTQQHGGYSGSTANNPFILNTSQVGLSDAWQNGQFPHQGSKFNNGIPNGKAIRINPPTTTDTGSGFWGGIGDSIGSMFSSEPAQMNPTQAKAWADYTSQGNGLYQDYLDNYQGNMLGVQDKNDFLQSQGLNMTQQDFMSQESGMSFGDWANFAMGATTTAFGIDGMRKNQKLAEKNFALTERKYNDFRADKKATHDNAELNGQIGRTMALNEKQGA
jgi:hypothetical protein